LVKGISRRVVVVKSPDPRVFDEAIFIVREDAVHRGVTNDEILRQAQDIAEGYISAGKTKKLLSRIPPAAYAAIGAGATAALWAVTQIAH